MGARPPKSPLAGVVSIKEKKTAIGYCSNTGWLRLTCFFAAKQRGLRPVAPPPRGSGKGCRAQQAVTFDLLSGAMVSPGTRTGGQTNRRRQGPSLLRALLHCNAINSTVATCTAQPVKGRLEELCAYHAEAWAPGLLTPAAAVTPPLPPHPHPQHTPTHPTQSTHAHTLPPRCASRQPP